MYLCAAYWGVARRTEGCDILASVGARWQGERAFRLCVAIWDSPASLRKGDTLFVARRGRLRIRHSHTAPLTGLCPRRCRPLACRLCLGPQSRRWATCGARVECHCGSCAGGCLRRSLAQIATPRISECPPEPQHRISFKVQQYRVWVRVPRPSGFRCACCLGRLARPRAVAQ